MNTLAYWYYRLHNASCSKIGWRAPTRSPASTRPSSGSATPTGDWPAFPTLLAYLAAYTEAIGALLLLLARPRADIHIR